MDTIRLGDVAHARSGDKGNHANIGVVVDDPRWYDFLRGRLTAEVVGEFLKLLGHTRVVRYELPNIQAFNFVLESALGGGASHSLRLDSQGKALGVVLMELRLPTPP